MDRNAKPAPFSPNYAVPPGETVAETLDALGMTQAELATRLQERQSSGTLRLRPPHERLPLGVGFIARATETAENCTHR